MFSIAAGYKISLTVNKEVILSALALLSCKISGYTDNGEKQRLVERTCQRKGMDCWQGPSLQAAVELSSGLVAWHRVSIVQSCLLVTAE